MLVGGNKHLDLQGFTENNNSKTLDLSEIEKYWFKHTDPARFGDGNPNPQWRMNWSGDWTIFEPEMLRVLTTIVNITGHMIPEFPDLVNVLYFLVVGKPLYLEESTWDTMVIKHGNGKCGPASQFFPMIFPCFATQQQVPGFRSSFWVLQETTHYSQSQRLKPSSQSSWELHGCSFGTDLLSTWMFRI